MKKPDQYDLCNKTAVVTGGLGLLGIQHGMALAEMGANVILADLKPDGQQEHIRGLNSEIGREAFFYHSLDVSDEARVRQFSEDMNQSYGPVSILINNAAINPAVSKDGSGVNFSRLEQFPLESWNAEISVGLTGAFLCSRYFGTLMAQRQQGIILNIASDLSVIAPDQRLYRKNNLPEDQQPVKPVTYSVIKTGLIGLTRYLASYWAGSGVRVNALSPGGVFNQQPDDFVEKLEGLIPMGRMAHVDEYKSTIQFLCSEASSYMTGQNIVVDGGRSVI